MLAYFRAVRLIVSALLVSACGPVTAALPATNTPLREAPVVTLTETPPVLPVSPTALPPSPWPTTTPFANEVTFKVMGQFGGPARAVAVRGHVAYLGIGPQVLILDVSDPARPRQIGQSGAFLDFVQDIVTVGDLVYVAAGSAGLRIMDLTKPLQPRQVGFIPSEGAFEKVIIREAKAFIAETLGEYSHQQNVIRLFDVSDPGSPRELNSQLYGRLLDVQGDQVYAIQDDVLKVIDVSLSMSLKATDTGLKNVSAVAGQYVYTVDAINSVLGIVDLSDPGNPQPRGSLKLESDMRHLVGVIKITDKLIYVECTFPGESGLTTSALFLVDVSNPDSPQQVGSWYGDDDKSEYHWAIPAAFTGEALEDNFLYLALGSTYSSNGLWIVDIHDPTKLHKVGNFSALTGTISAVSFNGFAYVLRFGFPNDLAIVDLSNLSNIQEQGTVSGVSGSEEMALKGHYLYMPVSEENVLDLSNSVQPVKINKTVSGLENSSNIKIADKHACVSTFNGGLNFVDISEPADPHLISHLDTENVNYLACADTEAFYIIPSYSSKNDVTSLHVVDTSDLTQPYEVASQDLPGDYVDDIAYNDEFLYVMMSFSGSSSHHKQLLVFDVSDKARPRQVNASEIELYDFRINILDHYAYLAGDDIMILDISDPTHLRPLGKIGLPCGIADISILKQDTLLAAACGGIFLLQVDGLK